MQAKQSASVVNTDNELLTQDEAAVALGLKNANTLAVWRSTKSQPALRWIKIGRNVRYRHSDIQAFLAAMTRGGNVTSDDE